MAMTFEEAYRDFCHHFSDAAWVHSLGIGKDDQEQDVILAYSRYKADPTSGEIRPTQWGGHPVWEEFVAADEIFQGASLLPDLDLFRDR